MAKDNRNKIKKNCACHKIDDQFANRKFTIILPLIFNKKMMETKFKKWACQKIDGQFACKYFPINFPIKTLNFKTS